MEWYVGTCLMGGQHGSERMAKFNRNNWPDPFGLSNQIHRDNHYERQASEIGWDNAPDSYILSVLLRIQPKGTEKCKTCGSLF